MIEISIMILILFILVLLLCIKYKNDHLIRSLKRRIWLIDNMISERRYYGHKDHTFLLKERKNIEDELKPLIYKICGKE